jgi:hypothetical protein
MEPSVKFLLVPSIFTQVSVRAQKDPGLSKRLLSLMGINRRETPRDPMAGIDIVEWQL